MSALASRKTRQSYLGLLILLVMIWILIYTIKPLAHGPNAVSMLFSQTSISTLSSRSSKAAVLIESRPLSNIRALLHHYSSVLGPTWPVIFYTSPDLIPLYQNSKSLQYLLSTTLELRPIPADVDFNSHGSVSAFLTDPFIWRALAPAKHILLFQADTIICSASNKNADDFIAEDWHFIGAPIPEFYGRGWNGGLSIRNRETVLRIIEEEWDVVGRRSGWARDNAVPRDTKGWHSSYEDQWFGWQMSERMERERGKVGENRIKLPSIQNASEFAVEVTYAEKPFGYHQVERWQSEKLDKIKEWCPEYTIALGGSSLA